MTIELRQAKDSDRSFLAAVIRDAIPLYEPLMPGAFEKQAQRFLDKGLPENYQLQIIDCEKQSIGFLGTLLLDERTMYLPAFYLKSEYQRQGYGKRVLACLENQLISQQIQVLALLVHGKAHWARAFYNQNGFSLISEDLEKIKQYRAGKMTRYALPHTLLMEKPVAI